MNRVAGRELRLHAPGAFLLAAGGLALAVKSLHAQATVDELGFVLGPTAFLVSALTGTRFVFEPGFGWVSTELGYVLVASCSGANFLVAALLALAWTTRRRVSSWERLPAGIAAVGAGAWALTVLANAARLTLALPAHASATAPFGLGAEDLHRLLGVVVYLVALLAAVEIAAHLPGGAREAT